MGISRRGLLAGVGATGALALVGGRWTLVPAGAAPGTPTAALAPDPVTSVLRAYLSTLVPGPGDDPEGTPGAVEAGGVEQLLAQAPYVVPPITADVTAAALGTHGRDFASLAYPEREALLVDAFADGSRSPYHLIALAVGAGTFYGDFRNRVGGTHLGFPGPSDGYLATYTDRTGHGQPQAEAVPP